MNFESDLFRDFTNFEPVGKGAFSSVHCAVHKITGIKVAIKSVKKMHLEDPIVKKNFDRELKILKSIDFPFIVHYYRTLEDDQYFYILMEFAKYGSLLNFLNTKGILSEDGAKIIFSQFLAVLFYLHNQTSILHRDIKMENILLTVGSSIRVIDFGLSSEFIDENDLHETRCGSFPYAAPEIFRKKPYGTTVDMWSAGVVLFTMTTGKLPFNDTNSKKLIHLICHEEPQYPNFISDELKDLLQNLLNKNRHERYTVSQAIEHPWILNSKYHEMIEYSLNQSQYRVKINEQDDLDLEIMARLQYLGYSLKSLKADLINQVETDTTFIYKILKQEKISESIRNLLSKKINEKGNNANVISNVTKSAHQFSLNPINNPSRIERNDSATPSKLPHLLNLNDNDNRIMHKERSSIIYKHSMNQNLINHPKQQVNRGKYYMFSLINK